MANSAKTTTRLPRLTMPDLVKVFRVSHITIINWKNPKEGIEHRKDPLPHFKDDATGRVTYNAKAVRAWALKHDVAMHVDPMVIAEKHAAQAEKAAAKPGPKPRTAAKKAPVKKRSKPIKKALLAASAKVSAGHSKPARKATSTDSQGPMEEAPRSARSARKAKPTQPLAPIKTRAARKRAAKPAQADVEATQSPTKPEASGAAG